MNLIFQIHFPTFESPFDLYEPQKTLFVHYFQLSNFLAGGYARARVPYPIGLESWKMSGISYCPLLTAK